MNKKMTALLLAAVLASGCASASDPSQSTEDTETEETVLADDVDVEDSDTSDDDKTAADAEKKTDDEAVTDSALNGQFVTTASGSQFMDLAFTLPEGYTVKASMDPENGDEITTVSLNNEDGDLILFLYDIPLYQDDDDFAQYFSTEAANMADVFVGSIGTNYTLDTPTIESIGQQSFVSIAYPFTVTQDDGDVLDGKIVFFDANDKLYGTMFAEHQGENKTADFDTMVSTLHLDD